MGTGKNQGLKKCGKRETKPNANYQDEPAMRWLSHCRVSFIVEGGQGNKRCP